MKFSEIKAIIEGKSFKRNDEEGDKKKKQDEQRRKARDDKREPVEESASDRRWFKNKAQWQKAVNGIDVDEDTADSAYCDGKLVAKWIEADQEGWVDDGHMSKVDEGKSFKRNKDEDADKKKKDDQQRRDSRKREPVEESSNIKKGAFHKWLGKSEDSPITQADIAKGLKSNDPHVRKMAQFAKNMKHESVEMDEGKSFKRNDDDSMSKKEKDDERRKAREEKQRTDESVLVESADDEDAQYMLADQTPDVFGSAAAYVKHRLNNNLNNVSRAMLERLLFLFFKRRVELNDLYPSDHVIRAYVEDTAMARVLPILGITLNEGKSFKRNDDDSKSKKQKDEERKKARDDKRKRTDEGWVRVYDKKELTTALKAKYGDQLSAHKMPSNTVQYMINGIKTVGMWDGMMKQGKMLESVSQSTLKIDEAADISFNDAKAELPQVKDRLGKMNPFHPDYVNTKARHDKLQDRLSRMKDDDELDEASDISFNDAKAELPQVKDRLSKMSPFHPDYIKTKSHHDKLQDRLSRMKDDDAMDESYVDNAHGYGGDTMDVCEDGEDHDHEVGEDVIVTSGKYTGMEGKVAKIGPGPYKVVQLKGGKQVRLENSEMKCATSESYNIHETDTNMDDYDEVHKRMMQLFKHEATDPSVKHTPEYRQYWDAMREHGISLPHLDMMRQRAKHGQFESYVSGDDTSGSDDVIEDLNMEDFVMPRDQAHDLADEVETKKDGHLVSPSEIERMKQLAGLNKI